jgi:ankyrin repeat protein
MPEALPFTATIHDYKQQAKALFKALLAGDERTRWRFKWNHPRFRDEPAAAVLTATLSPADAELVLAHEYEFETWADVERFADAVARDGPVARFETAVEAVVSGDAGTLRGMLDQSPDLVSARSTRRHHATLLHYIAANGVEGFRQKTPPNAVEIATLLLDAGAEADSLADMYDAKCTTMSMLVSSSHPHAAGLQGTLAETLLDHGAALEGPGSNWQSALMTALTFGFVDTAEVLAARGAPVGALPAAAGLGRVADVARLLPDADEHSRHVALALAAQLGRTEVVRLLLDAGVDPSRYNPDGFHSHATPLHQAVWSTQPDVVCLLVERGARLDMKDKIYEGTPLDWALYGERTAVADYLREKGAS